MKQVRRYLPHIFLLALLLAGGLSALWLQPQTTDAQTDVKAAWDNARAAGSYHFSADIKQTTIPLTTAQNIGQQSKQQTAHLEGDDDVTGHKLLLSLWSDGGSVNNPNSAIQLKVDGGQAFARQGDGDWQPTSDVTQSFAPDGDFLTYLTAAKDIVKQGKETRTIMLADGSALQVHFTRYSFTIDGPGFAQFIRDNLQARLEAQGKLPYNMSLGLASQYESMTGDGELWIRSDGLPLRQIVTVHFPPQGDNRVDGQFTIDFSNYPSLALRQPLKFTLTGLSDFADSLQSIVATALAQLPPNCPIQLLIAAFILFLTALGIRYYHTRLLYAILTIFIITSMLFSQIIEVQQASAFSDSVNAQEQQQAQTDQSNNSLKDFAQNAQTTQIPFAPNVSPLVIAVQQAKVEQTSAASDFISALNPPPAPRPSAPQTAQDFVRLAATGDPAVCDPTKPNTDSDGDGLTNCEEVLLGTDAYNKDTDRDGLSDFQEVNGFTFNNKKWYTDPNKPSTLDDGITDGQKCPPDANGQPNCARDTDKDGTPDVLDRDLDGDQVPNNEELSPFAASSTTFDQNNPFLFALNGVTPQTPTTVEFQIRPTNPDHLWYALNVLDWPDGDTQGQIQRDSAFRDDDKRVKTFFDECVRQAVATTPCQMSPDANGDIKLIPMLEIELPPAPNNLPSASELNTFGGISVKDLDKTGAKVAYVPLQVTTDPKTENRSAFYGNMLFRPGASWGAADKVRLVWMVQMLVDQCQDTENGSCVSYIDPVTKKDMHNQLQIVQTYYDSFTVTGVNVREDHGDNYAIAYEDPKVDDDLNNDNALVPLETGLEATFLADRLCDPKTSAGCDGKTPDLTVNGRGINAPTIADRFDRLKNEGVSEQARWDISNTLRVVNKSYEYRDQALATLAMTDTKAILDNFTPFWKPAAPITPTLLFAREETFRALNLSQVNKGNIVKWNGNQLTLDFNADGGTPLTTLAGLNWAPYRFDGSRWQSEPMDQYWNELSRRSEGAEPTLDPDVAAGHVGIFKLYYLAVNNGTSNVVHIGNVTIVDFDAIASDPELFERVAAALRGTLRAFNQVFLNKWFFKGIEEVRVSKYIGVITGLQLADVKAQTQKQLLEAAISKLWDKNKFQFTIAAILAVATLATIILFMSVKNIPVWVKITGGVLAILAVLAQTLFYSVYRVVHTISIINKAFGASLTLKLLGSSSELLGTTIKSQIVGLVINFAIAWGIFVYQITEGGIQTGTFAFNTLLAQAIATTLVAIVLFIIGLSIIGTVLVALIGAIDLITLLVCKILDKQDCFPGITTAITNFIAKLIYSGGLTVDFDHTDAQGNADLIKLSNFKMALQDPAQGFIFTNKISFSGQLTTTLFAKVPGGGPALNDGALFNQQSFRSNSFKASFSFFEGAGGGVDIGTMVDKWTNLRVWFQHIYTIKIQKQKRKKVVNFYTGQLQQDVKSDWLPLPVGGNQKIPPLYLNLAYAVVGYDCWVGICRSNTFSSVVPTNLASNLIFDVLPPTLDEFHNKFFSVSAQKDFDGDGLLSRNFGGTDPNDTQVDSDNDGLPDSAELKNGTKFNNADTDGDGLPDGLELQLGTDPTNPDTDGDGLTDAQEVNGYLFTYAPGKQTLIRSNPLSDDSDGDGVSDAAEVKLGTNALVANENPLVLSVATSAPNAIAKSGDTGTLTAIVQNNATLGAYGQSTNLMLRGRFTDTLPARMGGTQANTSFILAQGDTVTRTMPYVVSGNGSATVTISNTALANLELVNGTTVTPTGSSSVSTEFKLTIDNDPPTSALASYFVPPNVTTILGGTASDPTSFITRVQVAIDGAPFRGADISGCAQSGNGSCVWAFAYDVPAADTTHTVEVRATDAAGNVQTTPTKQALYVDALAPRVTANLPSGIVKAPTDANRLLVLPLNGSAVDPGSGPNVSKVAQVQVLLEPSASGWQTATINVGQNPTTWSLHYPLSGLNGADPSGTYNVTVRATDNATNQTVPADYFKGVVRIDNTAPVLTLQDPVPSDEPDTILGDPVISQSLTLRGIITDTEGPASGVKSGEIALTPDYLTDVYSSTLVVMGLDDLPNAQTFRNDASLGQDGTCDPGQCPTANAPGMFGTAALFDASKFQRIVISSTVPISNYTSAAWFNTTCQDCGIQSVDSRVGTTNFTDREMYLSGGNVCADVQGNSRETICSANQNYADGNWHMVAQVLGADGQFLYVDGALAASGLQNSSRAGTRGNFILGRARLPAKYYSGSLDEVKLFSTALNARQVSSLFVSWKPLALGPGTNTRTWSYPIPAELEGNYEIDLTDTDNVGNRNDDRLKWNHYRAEIDTRAPQLNVSVKYTGAGKTALTTVTGTAIDLNLSEPDVKLTTCTNPTITRTYNSLTRPDDVQRLNQIDLTCTVPGFISAADQFIRACDLYQHCASRGSTDFNVVVASDTGIQSYNPNNFSQFDTLIGNAVPSQCQLCPITPPALDLARGFMYWATKEQNAFQIYRAKLDGTSPTLLTNVPTAPLHLALDSKGGKMYWTDGTLIRRANLDGSGIETVYGPDPAGPIRSLALDLAHGKMYLARNVDVVRINLDGSGVEQISKVLGNSPKVYDISINPNSGLVSWIYYGIAGGRYSSNPFISIYQYDTAKGTLALAYNIFIDDLGKNPTGISIAVAPNDLIYFTIGTHEVPRRISPEPIPGELHRVISNSSFDSYLLVGKFLGAAFTQVNPPTINEPALTISKSPLSEFVPNTPLTYTLRVRNIGPSTASNVVVTDTLPAQVSFASASSTSGGNCSAPGGANVRCTLPKLSSFDSATITLQVQIKPNTLGEITNFAGAQSPDANPDLGISSTFNKAPVSLRWIFCVNQGGNCLAFSGLRTVRYGANGIFTTRVIGGPFACDNTNFDDPLPGVAKHCDYLDEPGPTPTRTATRLPSAGSPTPTPTATAFPTITPFPTGVPLNHDLPVLDSAILTPTNGAVITSLAPLSIIVAASAQDSIKSVQVTVNGTPIATFNRAKGVSTNETFTAAWTPPAFGVYTLNSTVIDWKNQSQQDTHPVQIIVSNTSPSIAITSDLLTTKQLLTPSSLELVGTASAPGTAKVEIQTGGGAFQPAEFDGTTWHYSLIAGDEDGTVVQVTARITDSLGRTATATKNVTVDNVPPTAVTLTLRYHDASGDHTVTPGQTVYAASPSLLLNWSASSDGNGLGNYLVGWTSTSSDVPNGLKSVSPNSAHSSTFKPAEAQVYYAHVVAQDVAGNQTPQTIGPIYIDSPRTPDLLGLNYQGWMNSGASQFSDNQAVALNASPVASLRDPQNFYLTWNADTLRMAWTGADWNNDGDLFIYLDSAGGGATALFNPYPDSSGTIRLPNGFGADYLIWVKDNQTAQLMQWNDSGWTLVQLLGADKYAFDRTTSPSRTDLMLPFALLGLNANSSLKVLAVASEDNALRLFATAPDKNPLNSPRVINYLAQNRTLDTFQLTNAFTIPSLASGVLPNAGRFTNSNLRTTITSNPQGIGVGFLSDTLFDAVTPGTPLDANLDGVPDHPLPFNLQPAPVHNGQTVTYNLHYQNLGSGTAQNVVVTAQAFGALRFANNATSATFNLGNVGAGISKTLQIKGTINTALNGKSAEMDAAISDAQHGTFDYVWMLNPVDSQPPQNVQILNTLNYAKAGLNLITGLAADSSGAPKLDIEITARPSNNVTTLHCTDPTPNDGQWTCDWNLAGVSGIDHFDLRARATDANGLVSDWSPVQAVYVDTTPPTIALNPSIDQFLTDGYLNATELNWNGTLHDNREVAGLTICLSQTLNGNCIKGASFAGSTDAQWGFDLTTLLAGDGISRTIALYGLDGAGNSSSAPVTRHFTLDTVAPVITVTNPISVGLQSTRPKSAPLANQTFTGSVTDGGGVSQVFALLFAPDGTVTSQPALLNGSTWSIIPRFGKAGVFGVQILALDRAGNQGASDTYTVQSNQQNQFLFPLVGASNSSGGGDEATPTPTPTLPVPSGTATPEDCDAPTLLSPDNNALVSTRRVTLRWSGTACANSYNVTVRDASDNSVVIQAMGLTQTQFTTKALTANKTYSWQVTSVNPGRNARSEIWQFQTGAN